MNTVEKFVERRAKEKAQRIVSHAVGEAIAAFRHRTREIFTYVPDFNDKQRLEEVLEDYGERIRTDPKVTARCTELVMMELEAKVVATEESEE